MKRLDEFLESKEGQALLALLTQLGMAALVTVYKSGGQEDASAKKPRAGEAEATTATPEEVAALRAEVAALRRSNEHLDDRGFELSWENFWLKERRRLEKDVDEAALFVFDELIKNQKIKENIAFGVTAAVKTGLLMFSVPPDFFDFALDWWHNLKKVNELDLELMGNSNDPRSVEMLRKLRNDYLEHHLKFSPELREFRPFGERHD